MRRSKVEKAILWFSKNRALYEALAKKVESIVKEILDSENINYHSITSRAKNIDSYEKKASREGYVDPRSEITDMAGIRIITYIDSDARRVARVIQEAFEILPDGVIDKTKELGIDKVGYRSIHCTGTLGDKRLKLPENRKFKGMCFEIQVRTILQHVWAEFEHDRNYKFSGVLPKDIRRRLSIIAGNLELIDREFDSISDSIDAYVADVNRKTEKGDLSISIDSKSLTAYMTKRFQPLVRLGVTKDFGVSDNIVIRFLSAVNINTVKELENIIPKDFVDKETKYFVPPLSFFGIIFDLLVIHDVDKLLESWKEEFKPAGIQLHSDRLSLYKEYGIDFREYVKKHSMRARA